MESMMDIENLTLKEIKQISAIASGFTDNENKTFTPHIGKKCIIRSYASGVHFGTLAAQNGRQVELKDSRRMWRWQASKGISLSAVAVNGIDDTRSRITETVEEITLLDALEIIPASDDAISSIEGCAPTEQS